MSRYILDLIKEGEHQQLDFKFEIADSKKIARTLAAFANTDGGKLLIGVKDNGSISGVRSEEEFYMVEAAATMFCRPEVLFSSREWNIEGKKVLEIVIPRSEVKHSAPAKDDDRFMIYIRRKDQNFLANATQLLVWKKEQQNTGIELKMTDVEKGLLSYLERNEKITLKEFRKEFRISKPIADHILSNFIVLDLIEMEFTENEVFYQFKNEG